MEQIWPGHVLQSSFLPVANATVVDAPNAVACRALCVLHIIILEAMVPATLSCSVSLMLLNKAQAVHAEFSD